MAGLHAALTAIQPQARYRLQLGFPYVDVLKQPQVVFHGGELLQGNGLNELKNALEHRDPTHVIVELPSNPLLRCVDLPVWRLARRGIPVIAGRHHRHRPQPPGPAHVDLILHLAHQKLCRPWAMSWPAACW